MKLHQILENEQQIKQALDEMLIDGDYEITSNGVDVYGHVSIPQRTTKIPVQFNVVTGNFICSYTKITSLKGAPTEVGGNFACTRTKITSLEGAPTEVGGNFICIRTNITSLKGAPTEVGGNFKCAGTKITSLEGAPREVGGHFVCTGTNIQGKPDASHIDIGGQLIWE